MPSTQLRLLRARSAAMLGAVGERGEGVRDRAQWGSADQAAGDPDRRLRA